MSGLGGTALTVSGLRKLGYLPALYFEASHHLNYGIEAFGRTVMRNKLFTIVVVLLSFVASTPAATRSTVYQERNAHHHRIYAEHHQRYYIRHRTKWQHTKIIGGTPKTGMSVGGLIGGPPGMAVGAAAGAAAGTAYDVKTRKVKVRR